MKEKRDEKIIALGTDIVEVTPWFEVNTFPHKMGVFQTKLAHPGAAVFYSNWNGRFWGDSELTADRAAQCPYQGNQAKFWRGLLKERTSC